MGRSLLLCVVIGMGGKKSLAVCSDQDRGGKGKGMVMGKKSLAVCSDQDRGGKGKGMVMQGLGCGRQREGHSMRADSEEALSCV